MCCAGDKKNGICRDVRMFGSMAVYGHALFASIFMNVKYFHEPVYGADAVLFRARAVFKTMF